MIGGRRITGTTRVQARELLEAAITDSRPVRRKPASGKQKAIKR
jgi:hypothetical protein